MSGSEVYALHEGTFSVGLDKKFVRLEPDQPAGKGALRIALNPFLIRNDDRTMLLDCGLGDFGEESHIPWLLDNLHKQGVEPDEVTDLFLSHLHFDHIGGLANRLNGYWELTFPSARIWLSGEEFAKLKKLGQKDVLKEQFVDFVEIHADLNLVKDGDEPFPGVRTQVIGGHTEFSLAWYFDFGDLRLLNAGDVIGTKSALTRRYAAKYDFDGKESQQRRDELLKFAHEREFTILAYHDTKEPIIRKLPEISG